MDSFAAFILTHGRPDNVGTFTTLRARGYTGRIVILIDDMDSTAERYLEIYGDQVEIFDKQAAAATFDQADNFSDMRAIVYARNACFQVAERLGITHFIQLDDDYQYFEYRYDSQMDYATGRGVYSLDRVFAAMVDFLETSGAATVAMAQGGDFIGGRHNEMMGGGPCLKRKAMNSFVCRTSSPVGFLGRINEDVNTYTRKASTGDLFLTLNQVSLTQETTQKSSGGMSGIYLDSGTYVKSFYSILFHPSSVHIQAMGDNHYRLHHRISWKHTTPMILSEEHRKEVSNEAE